MDCQIGRVAWVSPFQREKYYLRILLYVVPGCSSFEELKTVNGVVMETFQLACLERGLLANDQECDDCLREASLTQSGNQLRTLYTIIL
jgi:hypothetical protein